MSAILIAIAFAASFIVYYRRGTVGLHGLEFEREASPAEFWSFVILLSFAAAGVVFLLTGVLRN